MHQTILNSPASNVKVKVRGIYSTALTKFLLSNGFEIVNPSNIINERFDMNGIVSDSADVLIYDKADMNGITISGVGAERIVDVVQSYFFDIAVKKMETGAIYSGKIKKIETKYNNIYIDLGNNEEGVLNLYDYWGFLREGEKVLVQVKGMMRTVKLLSTKLRLFGDNMILIKDGFTKVSKHITDFTERDRLKKIADSVKVEGWGILWKSHAEGKSDAELVSEINKLASNEKNLKEDFSKSEKPGLLERGSCVYFVDFGALSKQKLDTLRNGVAPTIIGHHFLKSGGYLLLTEFAESLQEQNNGYIVSKLNNALKADGPKVNMYYEIIHKKPGGKDIVMKGIVEKATDKEIMVKRKLRKGGRLDGLDIDIAEGDYALTTFQPNSWFVIHKYFNKDGYPKGTYININTQVEVYPKFARYIDLEVDVIEKNNKREIIDVEKLNHILNAGIIKKELSDKAMEMANQMLKEELK